MARASTRVPQRYGDRVGQGRRHRGIETVSYPWPARRNRAASEAEASAQRWVSAFDLIESNAEQRRFEEVSVGLLAAYAYPDADPETLELIARVMAWIFIQDDRHDHAQGGERPEQVEARTRHYLEILRTGRLDDGLASPPARALADLAPRLIERGSPAWHAHFVETMRRFWLDGIAVEAYYRAHELTPDPCSYMAMRTQSVGVYLCLDLVELATGRELSAALRADPVLQRMTWLTSRCVAYVNDVFSYDKESRAGDVNNYLQVARRDGSTSLSSMVDDVVRLHDRELGQFCQLESSLPDFGPDAAEAVTRYVEGCRSWMSGALRWQQVSRRYASGRALLQGADPRPIDMPRARSA